MLRSSQFFNCLLCSCFCRKHFDRTAAEQLRRTVQPVRPINAAAASGPNNLSTASTDLLLGISQRTDVANRGLLCTASRFHTLHARQTYTGKRNRSLTSCVIRPAPLLMLPTSSINILSSTLYSSFLIFICLD